MLPLTELKPGQALVGLEPDLVVTIAAVVPITDGAVQVYYKTPGGSVKERLLNTADDTGVSCDMFDNGAEDASCVDPLRCGNGITEAGEACDDGNNTDGDCCSATCTAEPAGQACADDGNVLGERSSSRSVKSRPATSSMPSVKKYCEPTTSHCARGNPPAPPMNPSERIRFVLLSRPSIMPFSA